MCFDLKKCWRNRFTHRSTGAYIAGTNGTSNGIIPMVRVFNNTARYVDQGGNKRPGAFALYLEPWHSDILISLILERITVKKKSEPEICSQLCGFQICS